MDNPVTPVIHIRQAELADAAAIANVLRLAFSSYQPSFTPAAFAATILSPALMEERLRLSEGPIWVAVHNGECVGTVSAVAHAETLYIRSMGVAPAVRRFGLARQLLTHVEDYARHQGFPSLYLFTAVFLAPAIRLYEQFGLERRSDGPPDFHGTPILKLVKPLTEPPA